MDLMAEDAGERFPQTQWSRLLDRGAGEEARREAAAALCGDYWKPVYAFIRAQWGKTDDEAKDLTQAFFAWVLESDLLGRVGREGSRFRTFLKVALKHFLIDETRRDRTLKRGGGVQSLRIDSDALELPDRAGRTPEEMLDAVWRAEILGRAVEALGEKYRREGRETPFRIFREYYWAAGEPPGYRELASRHGVSESDVSNYLMAARRSLRDELERLIAPTVDSAASAADEFRALFGE